MNRNKYLQAMAVFMSLIMICSSIDMNALAQEDVSNGTIISVNELSAELVNQKLQVGANEGDVVLPSSLTVTVQKEQIVEKQVPVEDEEVVDETHLTEEIVEEITDTIDEEGNSTPEVSGENESQELSGENVTDEIVEEIPEVTQPEEPIVDKIVENIPEDSSNESEANEITTPAESLVENVTPTQSNDAAPVELAPAESAPGNDENGESNDTGFIDWLFPAITVNAAEAEPAQEVAPAESTENETVKYTTVYEKETITNEVTFTDVTWHIDAAVSSGASFDSSQAGAKFVYIPNIPSGYAVATSMPTITVEIIDNSIQATALEIVVDGVRIKLDADPGVFPKGATLDARKVEAAEEKIVEAALDEVRPEDKNIVSSYTFDIKVLDKNGNEVQPDTSKGKVKVSFELEKVSNENLETDVYHTDHEMNAEKLESETVATNTVQAETDGFSYYTVEFTYNNLQYVMDGNTEIPLQTILDYVGLSGTVADASVSNSELFSVEQKEGQWVVTAHQAFITEEWLKVTIDGVEYEIIVTDDASDTATVSTEAQLREAIANASISTIYIAADIEVACGTAPTTNTTTQNLNGDTQTCELIINRNLLLQSVGEKHSITRTGSGSLKALFGIRGNGRGSSDQNEVTFSNIVIDGGARMGTINSKNTPSNSGCHGRSIIDVYMGAIFNLEDGVELKNGFIDNAVSSLRYDSAGKLSADFGGGIRVDYTEPYGGGTVNVKAGAVIHDCFATSYGGAIGAYNYARLNVYGGTIYNCATNKRGGAIGCTARSGTDFSASGVIYMYGGEIYNCYASNGGAFGADDCCASGSGTDADPYMGAVFRIYGGNIHDCHADSGKGGAFSFEGTNRPPSQTVYRGNLVVYLADYGSTLNIKDCSSGSGTISGYDSIYKNDYVTLITSDAVKTLTFDKGNGQTTSVTVTDGQPLGEAFPGAPANPDPDKHFMGWNTDEDGTGNWITKDTPISEDLTLYAIWAEGEAEIDGNRNWIYGDNVSSELSTLSVSVDSSEGDVLNYQWYKNTSSSNSGGTSIAGANGATYSVPNASALPAGDYYYYCIVTVTRASASATNISKVAKISVAQKEIGLSWGNTSFVYNGTAQGPTVTATGLVGSDSCAVVVSGQKTAVGNYIATAESVNNPNYKLPASNTKEFSITKKSIIIRAANQSVEINGSIKQFTQNTNVVVAIDLESGHSVSSVTLTSTSTAALTTTGTITPSDATIRDAMNADVTNNYNITYETGVLKVTKASVTLQTTPTLIPSITYDGNTQPLVQAGVADGGTILYSIDGENWSEDVPSADKAGNYNVYYYIKGDNNHEDLGSADSPAGTLSVTIAKKIVTVSGIGANNKYYDGTTEATANTSTAVFTGICSGDVLTIAATAAFSDAAVGESKTVTLSNLRLGGADAANYNLSDSGNQTSTTATIMPRSIENALIVFEHEEIEKTGSAVSPVINFVELNGSNLTEGVDYEIDTTSDISATEYGEYTFAIKGIGNYGGNASKTWKITKTLPQVDEAITATIRYGQCISDGTITGSMKNGTEVVEGTFAWVEDLNDTNTLQVGSYPYYQCVVFTPNDTDKYATVHLDVNVIVKPAFTVNTLFTSDVEKNSARIYASIDPATYANSTYIDSMGFEYKKSSETTYTTVTETVGPSFATSLSGLSSNTKYEYRAFIIEVGTTEKIYGEVKTFSTLSSDAIEATGMIRVRVDRENPNDDTENREIVISVEHGNDLVTSKYLGPLTSQGLTCEFENLPDGQYNVVCRTTDGTFTETKLLSVIDGQVAEAEFTILKGKIAAVVEVKTADTPRTAVDGLDRIIDDSDKEKAENGQQDIEVKLEVEKKSDDATGMFAIASQFATGEKVDLVLDIGLFKTVKALDANGNVTDVNKNNIGSQNNVVLVIAIPYANINNNGLSMYRYHDGVATRLTKLSSKPNGAGADGTFFADVDTGYIFLYACCFSTYAITYEDATVITPTEDSQQTDNNGSNSSASSGSGSSSSRHSSAGAVVNTVEPEELIATPEVVEETPTNESTNHILTASLDENDIDSQTSEADKDDKGKDDDKNSSNMDVDGTNVDDSTSADQTMGAGDKLESNCYMHWYILALAIVTAVGTILLRKKKVVKKMFDTVAVTLMALLAIMGSCMWDWIIFVTGAVIIAAIIYNTDDGTEKQ